MGNPNPTNIETFSLDDGREQILSALESGVVVVDRDGTVLIFDNSGAITASATAEDVRMMAAIAMADPRASDRVVTRLALLRRVVSDINSAPYQGSLSRREQDVLRMICHGLRDFEMAEELGLSRHTVRNHVASLYRKLRIKNRSAAVIWAYERGFASGKSPASVAAPACVDRANN